MDEGIPPSGTEENAPVPSCNRFLNILIYILRRSLPIVVIFAACTAFFLYMAAYHFPSPDGRPLIGHSDAIRSVNAMEDISEAQQNYKNEYRMYGTLEQLWHAGLIDIDIAKATKPQRVVNGYYYNLRVSEEGWSCVAMPAKPGITGERSFYIDQTGIIRHAPCKSENDSPAGPDSREGHGFSI